MLISKSRYLSLFNVFFFSTKYFIIFGKVADQGNRWLARTKDHILYFTILQYKVHSFNMFRTIDRSTRGLLAKQLKKFPKSPSIYGQTVLTFAERAVVVFEWTLTELRFYIIKNLLWLFNLMVLSMCNLQKRLIRATFWVLQQAMFTERLKTNGTETTIFLHEDKY